MVKISDERREERRRQILIAAISCFSRRGFHGTRVKDICEEAGLSPGTVYLYFKNKEAILDALAEASRASNESLWASVEQGSDPVGQIETLFERLYTKRDPTVSRMGVQLWGEAIENSFLRDIYVESRVQLARKFTDILQAGGRCAPDDAEAIGELIVAAIAGFELRSAIEPNSDLRPAVSALSRLLRGEFGAKGERASRASPRRKAARSSTRKSGKAGA